MAAEHRRTLKLGQVREGCTRYFAQCQEGDTLPTVPGLALALGMEGRKQLETLAQGTGRAPALLRRALSQVEEANIQAAYKRDSGPSARFILQNGFGYSDKPEQGHGPPDRVIHVRVTGGEEG